MAFASTAHEQSNAKLSHALLQDTHPVLSATAADEVAGVPATGSAGSGNQVGERLWADVGAERLTQALPGCGFVEDVWRSGPASAAGCSLHQGSLWSLAGSLVPVL